MSDHIPTSEKLAQILELAQAPSRMVARARMGYYDDFKSPIATPIVQLVQDAQRHELYAIAERAKQGEFDAASWEAQEWAKSAEGQETFQQLVKGARKARRK